MCVVPQTLVFVVGRSFLFIYPFSSSGCRRDVPGGAHRHSAPGVCVCRRLLRHDFNDLPRFARRFFAFSRRAGGSSGKERTSASRCLPRSRAPASTGRSRSRSTLFPTGGSLPPARRRAPPPRPRRPSSCPSPTACGTAWAARWRCCRRASRFFLFFFFECVTYYIFSGAPHARLAAARVFVFAAARGATPREPHLPDALPGGREPLLRHAARVMRIRQDSDSPNRVPSKIIWKGT